MPSPAGLDVAIGGSLWWGGFTAELTISNPSRADLSSWSYSFISPHVLDETPWGATLNVEELTNGLKRYTLTGRDWGESIPAGGSITVGFNGIQGTDLGISGSFTAAMLLSDQNDAPTGSAPSAAQTVPEIDNGIDPSTPDHTHTEIHQEGTHHAGDGFIDITAWGTFHGSNHNSEHDELVGGRTPITTEALLAYNSLRAFQDLPKASLEEIGAWAYDQELTNNSESWGDDLKGVGLWFAMQGAKVGWMADERFDPQVVADLQRTARLGNPEDVMAMVRAYETPGFADHLEQSDLTTHFINTLKMEPHYGGWMHGRTHGFRSIEDVAIVHDIHHLTVLSWDQSQPFMNDTFDWPQWPALEVSDSAVINYFQGIVTLGDPMDNNSSDKPLSDQVSADTADPITGEALDIAVSGELWWGGFTAALEISNTSSDTLTAWSLVFESSHTITTDAWGVDVSRQALSNGRTLYTLSGADWGQNLQAGASVNVGFNAMQGDSLGNQGTLTAEQLFANDPLLTWQ